MKIFVVSYHAPPEITPRAFRANSIYESLKRKGYDVHLIAPKILDSKISNEIARFEKKTIASKLKVFLRKTLEKFLPGSKDLRCFPFFIQKLRNEDVDIVISIGLPFSVHLGVAVALRFFRFTAKKVVFDYGDPYSANPYGCNCFYAVNLERWVLKSCDYILTPVEDAVPLFDKLTKDPGKVKVVPQGYKIKGIKIDEYKPNAIPTFCYAGILYKGIREPDSFLKYLSELKLEFKFVIYTDASNSDVVDILSKYEFLFGNRLIIRDLVPRDKCIIELSKMDFLVNFSNQSDVQKPSKLVDYTLAKRPYISVQNDQNDFSDFDCFLKGDYSGFKSIDVSEYDESLVADKILSLTRG